MSDLAAAPGPQPGARAANITITAPTGELGRALLRATWASRYAPDVVAALVEADDLADATMVEWRASTTFEPPSPLDTITHQALITAARRAVLATCRHLRPTPEESGRG